MASRAALGLCIIMASVCLTAGTRMRLMSRLGKESSASSSRTILIPNRTAFVSNRTAPNSNHTTNYTTPSSNHTTNYTTPPSNHTTNYTTPSSNHTTPSSNHTTNYSTPPSNHTTNYSTPPSNHTTNYTTPSSNHTTNYSTPPSKNTTNYTTPPSNHTTLSSNHTTNYTTPPSNHTTPSSNHTTNYTTPPSNPTVVPTESKVVPASQLALEPYGCKKVSACVCETQSGARVDLTPLAVSNGTARFLDVADSSGANVYVYSWNPCYDFNEGVCQGVAACQTLVGAEALAYSLGGQQTVDFEVSSSRGLVMRYSASAPQALDIALRITYVQLRCDPEVEAEFTMDGELVGQSGIYYFTLTSRHACLSGGSNMTTVGPTPPTPSTPATPGVVTATAAPAPAPNYSLKTVVDLLIALTTLAGVGLVVLLIILVVIMVKRRAVSQQPQSEKAALALALGPCHSNRL